MTRNINAFPEYYNEAHGSDETFPGMELRDYFAARMMVYFLSKQAWPHEDYNLRNTAISAYKMADAMMAEREKAK